MNGNDAKPWEAPTIADAKRAETGGGTDAAATLAGDAAAAERPANRLSFDKYEVECELGRGGMGVVYRARQKDLGRTVALKMILASDLASAEQISRFQDEARAAAVLHHPNIVAIYEAGEIQGQPFFAMQYVAGPSLAERLRQGPTPPEEAARIVLAIARAVEHLHQHGIVHRDIKPSNVLLDELGVPYITDFGLAKMLSGDSRHTTTGAVMGTPSYMSPEQASGRRHEVGPLSDVYSLGTILYELLTGRPPFQSGTALDVLVQVLESEPVPPQRLQPGVPTDLETICLHCLEKAPEERYPSAAALADDLERFLKNEEIQPRPQDWRAAVGRWARRQPALAARLITLGLCALLVQVNFQILRVRPLEFHVQIMAILGVWMLASVGCQQLLNRELWADAVRLLWSGLDVVLFSAIVYVDDGLLSPISIGFPLLIAASGLWFRVSLVWFTSVIAMLSYSVLLVEHLSRQSHWHGLHKHVMFVIALAVLAFVITYQVKRVKALSRYYENRPLPR